jgi:hypothetical protein
VRIVASVVMAIGAPVAAAVPASAHTVSGQGATDTLTGITPATPWLTVTVVNVGSDLKLTWTGPTNLTVFGYQGEPYLFAAVFTALVIGLFGGLADVVSLARSQVPFEWGVRSAQVLVAVSIGVGAGLVIGSVIAFRLNRPAAPALEPSDATGAAIAGA